jgi:hypothetical protein
METTASLLLNGLNVFIKLHFMRVPFPYQKVRHLNNQWSKTTLKVLFPLVLHTLRMMALSHLHKPFQLRAEASSALSFNPKAEAFDLEKERSLKGSLF